MEDTNAGEAAIRATKKELWLLLKFVLQVNSDEKFFPDLKKNLFI